MPNTRFSFSETPRNLQAAQNTVQVSRCGLQASWCAVQVPRCVFFRRGAARKCLGADCKRRGAPFSDVVRTASVVVRDFLTWCAVQVSQYGFF